jgi:CRP-like cAMP-binding protein
MSANLLPFLQTIPMFAGMDDAELTRLGKDLKRKHIGAGKNVFFQGDPGKAVYIVQSGTVRIYVHAEDGQEVSVMIYGPGDLFGEMSLVDQLPRSATAVAVEKTVLWMMSDQDFYTHLRLSHQLALNVMLALSTRLRETNESIKSLASLDVTRRIAKRLLSLALRQGERLTNDSIRIASPLTQGDLASLISASRESTNRALRALQRKGLIDMQDGYLILLKPDELSSLLGTDETWW